MKKKTEYHPPMTGLEAHMEEEVAREANLAKQAAVRAGKRTNLREPCPAGETERAVEQAMQLGQ